MTGARWIQDGLFWVYMGLFHVYMAMPKMKEHKWKYSRCISQSKFHDQVKRQGNRTWQKWEAFCSVTRWRPQTQKQSDKSGLISQSIIVPHLKYLLPQRPVTWLKIPARDTTTLAMALCLPKVPCSVDIYVQLLSSAAALDNQSADRSFRASRAQGRFSVLGILGYRRGGGLQSSCHSIPKSSSIHSRFHPDRWEHPQKCSLCPKKHKLF
jgi:hypothetical protein